LTPYVLIELRMSKTSKRIMYEREKVKEREREREKERGKVKEKEIRERK
jgi:hypothetical protein